MRVFYVDNYFMPISHHQAGLVSGELLFLSWVPGDDFNGSGCSSLDDGVGVGESGVEQRHMLQQLSPGPRNLCQDCKGMEGIGTHRCILTHHQLQQSGDGTCVQSLGLTWKQTDNEI